MENLTPAQQWEQVAAEREGRAAPTPPSTPKEPVVEAGKKPEVDPVKEMIEQAEARMRNLVDGHRRNFQGEINNLTKTLQETVQAAQKAAKQVSDAPTGEQVKDAIKSPEEWEALKGEFPEWALATEKLLEAKLSSIPQGITPDAIDKLVNDKIEGKTKEVQAQIIDSALNAVFPGWKKEINSEAYAKWFSKQPGWTPELNDMEQANAAMADPNSALHQYVKANPDSVIAWQLSDEIGDAARLLRAYEEAKKSSETSSITEQRKNKLAAAASLPKGVRNVPTQKSPDEMSPAELWNYEAKKRDKRRS